MTGTAHLWKTSNGGATWAVKDSIVPVPPAATGFYDYVTMFDATNGYLLGDPATAPNAVGPWTLRRTTNGGETWSSAATVTSTAITEAGWNNSMQWLDANNAWYGTNSSKIYRTTNGGSTWTSSPTTFVNSYSVGFAALNAGLTGSDTGPFDKSTDGGATWTLAGATTAANFSIWANPGSQEF